LAHNSVAGFEYDEEVDELQSMEQVRVKALGDLDVSRQAGFEQFFTPAKAVQIMVDLFDVHPAPSFRILDPGAGTGILGLALAKRICVEYPESTVELVAVELDTTLAPYFARTLDSMAKFDNFSWKLVNDDFFSWSENQDRGYNFIIQNPPYRKLSSGSELAKKLLAREIRTPNLYSSFIQAAANLLLPNGQMVSISPRSWTNGTYFRKFREFIRSSLSLDAAHLFDSRGNVFSDTGVLQESLIWKVSAESQRKDVQIRLSHDHNSPASSSTVDSEVVIGQDFIFLPADPKSVELSTSMSRLPETLETLGIGASTGKIVDFRNMKLLRSSTCQDSIPYIRQEHLSLEGLNHPKAELRKPQWTCNQNEIPTGLLCPAGAYVLIKRFSTKEERRRIVASIVLSPTPLAIDNKVNFLHQSGQGLDPSLAKGLVRFLNTDLADRYFRIFSGHTQVNAGDLTRLPFPDRESLIAFGTLSQVEVEARLNSIIFGLGDAA